MTDDYIHPWIKDRERAKKKALAEELARTKYTNKLPEITIVREPSRSTVETRLSTLADQFDAIQGEMFGMRFCWKCQRRTLHRKYGDIIKCEICKENGDVNTP